jgi:hypothetical protein
MGKAAILLLMRRQTQPALNALAERAAHFDARPALPVCAGNAD